MEDEQPHVYVCMNDGGTFTGDVYTYPTAFEKGIFSLSDFTFYSLPSVKAYLTRNVMTHYHYLELFEIYVRRKYGIQRCVAAPDISVLADRRLSGTGISLEEYRRQCAESCKLVPVIVGGNGNVSHRVSEGIDVLYVERSSKGVSVDDYQTVTNSRVDDKETQNDEDGNDDLPPDTKRQKYEEQQKNF